MRLPRRWTTPRAARRPAEAGVVDAGGLGLLVLLDALTATVTGHAPIRRTYLPAAPAAHHDAAEAGPQFEVMYLVGDCDPAGLERLRAALDDVGTRSHWPAAAAGRHSVHVHTDDAGAAVEAGLAVGRSAGSACRRCPPGGWHLADGAASGRSWRWSTATAPRSCSTPRAPACCARIPNWSTRPTGSAPTACWALVDTGARR